MEQIDMFNQTKDSLKDKLKEKLPHWRQKAGELASEAWEYAKDNPDQVLLGLIALKQMQIDESLDNIEDSSRISAIVDADNYVTKYD